jgi:hypothetical protein
MENMDMLNANIMSLIEMLKQMGAADAGAPQAPQQAPQPEAPVEMAKAKEDEGSKEDEMEDKKEDEAKKAVSVQTPDNAATASDKVESKIDDDSDTPGTAAAEATMKAMKAMVEQMQLMAKELKAQKSLMGVFLEAINITEKSLFAPAPAPAAPVQKGYTAPAQNAEVLKSLVEMLSGMQKQPEVQKSRGEQVQDLTRSAAEKFLGVAE